MTLWRQLSRSGLVLFTCFLAACAAHETPNDALIADPYEGFNRKMLDVNRGLDRAILRPASVAYDTAMPETIRFVVRNGISHLSIPIDFANYLLQGNFHEAGASLARFTMNTVLGAGGLLDPATEFGLPKQETDFGITLGVWGVEEGPYLMLPLLGPATARELPSYIVDRAFSPLTYMSIFGPLDDVHGLPVGVGLVDRVDERALNSDLVDHLLYETEDSYVTLRSAYVQRRRAQLAGSEGLVENLPDIFDFDDE